MSDIAATQALVTAAVCGAPWSVDVGDEHWFIVCTQSPNHEGPHVGLISWPSEPVTIHLPEEDT